MVLNCGQGRGPEWLLNLKKAFAQFPAGRLVLENDDGCLEDILPPLRWAKEKARNLPQAAAVCSGPLSPAPLADQSKTGAGGGVCSAGTPKSVPAEASSGPSSARFKNKARLALRQGSRSRRGPIGVAFRGAPIHHRSPGWPLSDSSGGCSVLFPLSGSGGLVRC